MWYLSSPTRNRTCAPAVEAWSLNHWTVRDGPEPVLGTTTPCGAFPQQGKTQSLRAWGAGHRHLWCSHYQKGSTWQEGGRRQEEVGCPALRPGPSGICAHRTPEARRLSWCCAQTSRWPGRGRHRCHVLLPAPTVLLLICQKASSKALKALCKDSWFREAWGDNALPLPRWKIPVPPGLARERDV